ncbi:DUF3096 domain-containing protein [uncultured Hoeflea sp.]|uniref:DUF3096 domain-containing protein n=1 Tax=uncultured Hoeflea sp. TaxID=538666 RepID=UPI0030DA7D96
MTAQYAVIAQPLIALLAGLLILLVPRTLNYTVAAFLILTGLIGLFPHLFA